MPMTLRGRLIASYVAVLLPALLLATAAYIGVGIKYKRDDTYRQLRTTMYLVAPQVARALRPAATPRNRLAILANTDDIVAELANTRYRLLVVRADGVVLFDSRAGAASMMGGRIALPPALFTEPAPADPVNGALKADPVGAAYIYVVARPGLRASGSLAPAPAPSADPSVYAVLAQPAPDAEVAQDFVSRFLIFLLVGLLASLAFGLVLARSITRPVAALAAATRQIAQGNYAHQAPVTGSAELRGLATDFNRMATQVERAGQAQRDFLANVSHDLKTPLTSIQGFSQAMIDGAIRDPRAFREAAEVINSEAQRMARLVADVVDLARLQSGSSLVDRRPVDLAALLQRTVAGLQPQADARQVALHLATGPLPLALVDADRLHRALVNLLDNALRYTPAGGHVTLRAETIGEMIRIHVVDTGAGIPAEDLPRVFERFYQVDKSRATRGQGSGLGLAIVREVVAAHGGAVSVQSAPGQGADFTISLPLAAPRQTAPGAAVS
jgi:signal transduction histidine kinase